MGDQRVTFLRIKREQRAGNGGQHANDDPTISFQHKDEIVKMSVSSYGKAFVGTALKFIFENEGEYADVLERSLSKTNACSIVDDVMNTIRNDVPEQSRLFVNLKTLFGDPPTEAPADTNTAHATPRNDDATFRVQSAPAKDAPRTRTKYNKRCPPPLPKTPAHNNRPTWKNVPAAPTVNVRRTDDGRLKMVWTTKLMYKAEPIRYYELYYCRETDDPSPDVPTWKKCGEMTATKPPMTCALQGPVDGHTYYFALRAVDVRDRRAPFATTRITPRD